MSKCMASESHDDEPAPKHVRNQKGARPPSPLADHGAWRILEQYLTTTDMTCPQMEAAFASYLGDRYNADDWQEVRDALFSGNGDDSVALANLVALKARHVSQGASSPSAPMSATKAAARLSAHIRRPKNPFIDDEADDDDDDDNDEEQQEEEENSQEEDGDGSSVGSLNVARLPRPSAKDKYDRKAPNTCRRAASSSGTVQSRMYLLHVHRSATQRVAEHLRSKGFTVTISPWIPSQLYAISDSPKMIATSLELLSSSVKDYTYISEEEQAAVECSRFTLPNPRWVKITQGKYKGDIGYTVSDILQDDKVVGWSYKGERYYMGLLLKNFRCDSLELVASPHTNNIRLHLQSGWDVPFFKKTLVAFSLQFLRAGDSARPITGEVRSEIGTVVSTDHVSGSACLEFTLDEHRQELEFRLQDIERLEGYIIKKSEDLFHMCQEATNEEVEVLKYYLDRHPLTHVLQSRLLTQPDFNPLPQPESLQIGDKIEVCVGDNMGKCGIVVWFPMGATTLWFRAGGNIKDQLINVPAALVRRICPPKTLQFTKEKGYDVKPGDVVTVTCGPEFRTKGVVQTVDFPNACLTLISEGDYSLVNVPIEFIMKVSNANLDSFNNIIGQEVFIIGGSRKGYRATLYQLSQDTCSISRRSYLMPPCRSKTPPPDPVVPSNSSMDPVWPNWTYNPWVANNAEDIEDAIADREEKSRNNSPLPWLMKKEFALKLTQYHVVLKVSPSFMGGRLHNRFVSTTCPDPFHGDNRPAPDGCVVVFCTSNSAGAALQYYHIPVNDLSPAPPRKKKTKNNKKCLILDSDSHGEILTVAKCNMKKNTVEIAITARTSFALQFDQICLVEESRF
ncbi:uncharacterized protein F5891DRAFT_985223 [Suillus fuscotomentosus]|uniref:Uncharacterized protein n=1 Tax=Suillus fuscotomentosus TaxID=1912939 RepID=A0AAD4HF50_9AGAM|nr:uncharacterized protein F5891DRAFT_985223 [Suillus fuscotomentosus]KAG1894222.1 hypothetical protein F5891DRAFT_985223 [Suillus fuscotomentosus]